MAHDDDLDALLATLRSRGERVTTARRVVLRELLDAESTHLTVEDLFDRVHRREPEIHRSTVYRTLDHLTEAGLLAESPLDEGPTSYHLVGDEHHHARCTGCGAVIELPADVLAPVTRRLVREHGFVAEPHHLTITGLCATCAAQRDELSP